MKAAIYSRKSKFTGKGESVENQIELCKIYGVNNSYTDFLIYEDEGFSGGNINRPMFKSMMKDANLKKFDAIICYRLDRISRNVSDFSTLIDKLKYLNIDFISIREQFDTSSPMGTAMMFISSVFAQLERETIAERIRDNMYELAKTGRWLGGTPPFGFCSKPIYYLDNNSKQKKMMTLSPIAEEIDLVKYFYSQYLSLGSLGQLQKHLVKENIKTKRNARWDIKALNIVLRNPVYVKSSEIVVRYLATKGASVLGEPNGNGINSYNKKNSKGTAKGINEWILSVAKHEGIINYIEWLNVQRLLDKNKNLAPRLVTGSDCGLFNSVLHCYTCGGRMVSKQGHFSIETGEIIRYYVCSTKINTYGRDCDCKNIRSDILENGVMKEIFEITKNHVTLINVINKYKQSLEHENSNKVDIKYLSTQILTKQLQVKNLVDKIGINPNIYDVLAYRIEELKNEIKSLQLKKLEIENNQSNTEKALKKINIYTSMLLNFEDLFQNADYQMKRLLVNSLVDEISYDSKTKNVEIKLFCVNKKVAL